MVEKVSTGMGLERNVQNQVRLLAAQSGWGCWRNNVGVLMDARGVPVRFGLANDAPAVNRQIKSGDLILCIPRLITQEMVGTVIGQFGSRECKAEGWKPRAGDTRYQAQLRWSELINSLGGDAKFTTGDL